MNERDALVKRCTDNALRICKVQEIPVEDRRVWKENLANLRKTKVFLLRKKPSDVCWKLWADFGVKQKRYAVKLVC